MLSNSSCKTFDSRADGYARSEGVVVLILKRQVDTTTKHNVVGIVRGSFLNSDGKSQGFTGQKLFNFFFFFFFLLTPLKFLLVYLNHS